MKKLLLKLIHDSNSVYELHLDKVPFHQLHVRSSEE